MVNVGKWALIVGIVIAVISGFWTVKAVTLVMVILGLIVGFLNIADREVQPYLVASVALMLVGTAGLQVIKTLAGLAGGWLEQVFTNFTAFVAASALVVAVKAILALASRLPSEQ